MADLAARWNRLPRIFRGAVIAGLGATVALGALRAPAEQADGQNPGLGRAASVGNFAVGVVCDDPSAEVFAQQNGNTVGFQCRNDDGSSGRVAALAQVVLHHSPKTPDYNGVIDFAAQGDRVELGFSGDSGTAEVFEVLAGVPPDRGIINAVSRVTITN